MTDLKFPDDVGWTVMVETTFDGCRDPSGEDEDSPEQAEAEDSLSSSNSSDLSSEEDMNDPKVRDAVERGYSADWRHAEGYLPSDEDFCVDYTYSPPPHEPGRRSQKAALTGIHTPSSSPIMEADQGSDEDRIDIDMLSQLPRGVDPKFLTMDELKALFPHLSEDELEGLVPFCRAYRDKAYSDPGSDNTANHQPTGRA